MNLKICTCGKLNTTKNAKFLGRCDLKYTVLMFNCTCQSTFTIMKKADKIHLMACAQARKQAS